ncbi:MAG TPA: ankyrin repeat domain-containing protein [Pirellulales bacterium]|nr:ankyrin repeat domain-containing protein [Pirellulales bacterium]
MLKQSIAPFYLAATLMSFGVCGCGAEPPGQPGRDPRRYWSDPQSIALAEAIGGGNLAEIDKLVAAGADLNAIGKEDVSPLVWAIARQQKSAFRRLLEHGANPAVGYLHYESIVHLAARAEKDSDWLRLLLEHKADPNTPGFPMKKGGHALFDAIGKEQTPLFAATYSLKRENVELLVKAGADVNHGDATGETPLICAAGLNQFDIVYYLLEAGADYRRKERNGLDVCYEIINTTVSPDHELARWREKVIDWLRERGVSFEEAEEQLRDRERRAHGDNAAVFKAILKRWHDEEEARKARRTH